MGTAPCIPQPVSKEYNSRRNNGTHMKPVHGSWPVILLQYVCSLLLHDRIDRRLLFDFIERKLGAPDFIERTLGVLLLCVRRGGVSHSGNGPEMDGRSCTGSALLLVPRIHRRKLRFPPCSGEAARGGSALPSSS